MRTSIGRSAHALGVFAVAGSLAAVPARDANACGACFVQQDTPTVVSGHRMVLAISPDQTTLWDQIQYQGDPAEFAWVLPIKPGARVETASASFFEVLEAATQRQISSPQINCSPNGGGCGSSNIGLFAATGDEAGGGDGTGGGAPPAVTVVHQGTVGPYETVTLATDQPGALNEWLASHGYNVDAASQPIIDAYVSEGFDFIALRLQPGKGVTQMTPVRVISQGAMPALPLRMVGIGTGETVPIVLDIIGEGRWTVSNFAEAKLQTDLITWDFAANSSNYAEVRKKALEANDGRTWLTAYAGKGLLTSYVGVGSDGYSAVPFDEAYFQQAQKDGETAALCKPTHATLGVVENPCSGSLWDSPNCGAVQPGHIDARDLGCPGADDLATALIGMHVEDVWITRLEAELPHAALDQDLAIGAAKSQTSVAKDIVAPLSQNVDGVCGGGPVVPVLTGTKPPRNLLPAIFSSILGAAALALIARRARFVTR